MARGFGDAAVSTGIPLNLVQKWLGHARLTTTAIYADARGAEEKDIAERMWAPCRWTCPNRGGALLSFHRKIEPQMHLEQENEGRGISSYCFCFLSRTGCRRQ
jgi:hypothetical protein